MDVSLRPKRPREVTLVPHILIRVLRLDSSPLGACAVVQPHREGSESGDLLRAAAEISGICITTRRGRLCRPPLSPSSGQLEARRIYGDSVSPATLIAKMRGLE